MNQEKINDICEDFKKALQRLKEALSEDTTGSSIVIDGTIQRFEFTFELAWKLAKAILNYEGVEVETPRMVIKEAFKARLIKDGDGWIDMLKDRVLRYDFYADCGEVFDVWRVFKKTNPPTSPFTKGGGVPIRRMGRGILV
ncbi:MAG: nucleotidyltransferase substrate binding protein, partial [Elusimicrobia bacterium]|nr:nucleotidyltransferase substrate binding protein [Elusimicrobiota bacterium]